MRPSLAAVFKFRASVNLVGRSNGSSPVRTIQNLVEQRSLSITNLGEIWTVRDETAVPNDEVTFIHEWNAVRSGKFDNAFAVQTGQTVDHHKSGIRPFPPDVAFHRKLSSVQSAPTRAMVRRILSALVSRC
jgi:hypothetical protein